jgi:hypothetical protein
MLWLYREHDVIWNELREFLIEAWHHGPSVRPRMALTKTARNGIDWLCNEWASFKGPGLPSFKAWKVHYIHTVLHHHPERQHKPKQWALEKGDITEG